MVSRMETGMIRVEGRVDSTNAASVEENIRQMHMQGGPLTLDFDALSYISPAGLRALLKLQKTFGSVTAVNVNPEVYETFHVTGFDEMLHVKKALREITVDGCALVGRGSTGGIYRMDSEAVVKVFDRDISYEMIDKERMYAKTAFTHGVPTAIAYDVVKVGESYGVVYEHIDADTLGHAFLAYPERFDELIDKYVGLCRTISGIKINGGIFEGIQEVLNRRLERMEAFLSKEDCAMIRGVIDCIPRSDTLVHGDIHPGNIMLRDGELVLIDMADMTTGPQGYDLMCIYRDYCLLPQYYSKEMMEQTMGMPVEMIQKVWDAFIVRYLGTADKSALERIYQELTLAAAVNLILITGAMPESFIKETIPMIKKIAVDEMIYPNLEAIKNIYRNM